MCVVGIQEQDAMRIANNALLLSTSPASRGSCPAPAPRTGA
jgi:hypothetical protein